MSGTRYFPVAAKRRDTMRDTATVTVMALVSGLVVVGRYAPWPLSADIASKHDRFGAHRGADCLAQSKPGLPTAPHTHESPTSSC